MARQEGEMRFAPGRPWLPFRAEQSFPGAGIDFRWQARVRMAPLLRAGVLDCFEGGRGALTARLLGVIPVARSSGPATDKGEAMRGLAELPWRPFVFREMPGLSWTALDLDRLRATYADGQTEAEVEFWVDPEGRVLRGRASDRPRIMGDNVVEIPWSGIFSDYALFDGIRVPTVAEVSWELPEGPFTYWRGRIIDWRLLR